MPTLRNTQNGRLKAVTRRVTAVVDAPDARGTLRKATRVVPNPEFVRAESGEGEWVVESDLTVVRNEYGIHKVIPTEGPDLHYALDVNATALMGGLAFEVMEGEWRYTDSGELVRSDENSESPSTRTTPDAKPARRKRATSTT